MSQYDDIISVARNIRFDDLNLCQELSYIEREMLKAISAKQSSSSTIKQVSLSVSPLTTSQQSPSTVKSRLSYLNVQTCKPKSRMIRDNSSKDIIVKPQVNYNNHINRNINLI